MDNGSIYRKYLENNENNVNSENSENSENNLAPALTLELPINWQDRINYYNKLNVTNYSFRLVGNRGRGNCFFIALEQALLRSKTFTPITRKEIRKAAVDYLINDEQLVYKLLQQNSLDYHHDLREQTTLLNGADWPKGGPATLMENLSTDNPILHLKSLQQLKKILNRATYYADNEIIEATELSQQLNIIILSDTLGEVVGKPIYHLEKPFVIIYNYDGTHYELVEIRELETSRYLCFWSCYGSLPEIIRDFIPHTLVETHLPQETTVKTSFG